MIVIEGLRKSFTGRGRTALRAPLRAPIRVLDGIDLTARPGEFVSVIGPSGSGKSTLLNILAGLDTADAGRVEIDGHPLVPGRHAVAYMPQRDTLFPWRSVLDNVALPLQIRGIGRAEARARARELLPAFGLDGFERAHPFTLSGGMRQRAALARTIIQDRPTLLLDEPFGALDSLTRGEMQEFLLSVWARYERTVVFVTHDIREAAYLSDRVVVLSARPARVVRVVEVDLPRPRTLELTTSPEFARLEALLLRTLRDSAALDVRRSDSA
jgi:ABC-type nitrate/sulfonate/bicarbonate transport system ATPase subunit